MTALAALADPTRQRIVEMLAGGALSAGEIAGRFTLSAPAISQHLKTLKTAKLVLVHSDKQKRIYELNPEGVAEVAEWVARIRAFWNPKLDALEAALKREGEDKVMAMDAYGRLVNPQTVVFERLLPGPIERVFAFLVEEDKRKLWFTTGVMPTRVGERFTMHWKHSTYSPNQSVAPEKMKETAEKGHTSTFTLLAYEPPHRLAYTFGETKHPDNTPEVEFVLKPEGDKVRLTLTHTKVPDRGYALGVSGGWHAHLDVLEIQLKGETPPGFWDIWRKYDGVYDKRYA